MQNRKRAVKSQRSSVEVKVPQAGDLEPLSASFQRAVIARDPELAQALRLWEQRMIRTSLAPGLLPCSMAGRMAPVLGPEWSLLACPLSCACSSALA